MYRDYEVINRKTGEVRTITAVSARDALYQVVGLVGISYSSSSYYSGGWHTREERKHRPQVQLNCICGANYKFNQEDLRQVCTSGVLTCECGASLEINDERRYQSFA